MKQDLILKTLSRKEPDDIDIVHNNYPKLRITDEALFKICVYARLIEEITQRKDLESVGFLLNYTWKSDGITRDAVVLPAIITSITCDYELSQSLGLFANNLTWQIEGIWHNHHRMQAVRHSGPDYTTLDKIFTLIRSGTLNTSNKILSGYSLPVSIGIQELIESSESISFRPKTRNSDRFTIKPKNEKDRTELERILLESDFIVEEFEGRALAKSLIIYEHLYRNPDTENVADGIDYDAVVQLQKSPKDLQGNNRARLGLEVITERNGIDINPEKMYDEICERLINNGQKLGENVSSEQKKVIISKIEKEMPFEKYNGKIITPKEPRIIKPLEESVREEEIQKPADTVQKIISEPKSDYIEVLRQLIAIYTDKIERIEKEIREVRDTLYELFPKKAEAMRISHAYSDFLITKYNPDAGTKEEKYIDAAAKLLNKDLRKHYIHDLRHGKYTAPDCVPKISDWEDIKKAAKYLSKNRIPLATESRLCLEQMAEAVETNPEAVSAGVSKAIGHSLRKKAHSMGILGRIKYGIQKASQKIYRKAREK